MRRSLARSATVPSPDSSASSPWSAPGGTTLDDGRPAETRALYEQLVLADELAEFLTVPAYELLD